MFDRYIAFQARLRPHAIAVRHGEKEISFERFERDVNAAVAGLADLAVGPGDPVSVAVADPYREWVLVLALARLGIATASSADRGSPHVAGDGSRRASDVTYKFEFTGEAPAAVGARPDPTALARVLQSSGTTGEQKRVGMSWSAIDAAIRNAPIAYGAPEGAWLASTGIDTILGLVMTLACWATGNTALLGMDGRLRPERLAATRPRLISLVPDQLQRLLDDLPEEFERFPLRIVSGGGPVPPALARQTRARLTEDLRSVYGASETGSVAVAGIELLEKRPGAAGFILPGVEVEVVDDQGEPLPEGSAGRIRIRSNCVATDYLGQKTDRGETLAEGWFQSNDLGRLEADGLLMIDGRLDDMMNLGGHKVLPAWVEQAALDCPEVTEAAAFALPDGAGIDRCWLALVTTPEFDPAVMTKALKAQLVWLSAINLMRVDRLPRNAMGKVDRAMLRERVIAKRVAADLSA